jgi:hypothetical protein
MNIDMPDAQGAPFFDTDVGAGQGVDGRISDTAAAQGFQPLRAREVIGVYVGVQRAGQRQTQFLQQAQVTLYGIQHRIDQNRLARRATTEQIRVGTGVGFQQLPEEHKTSLHHQVPLREALA